MGNFGAVTVMIISLTYGCTAMVVIEKAMYTHLVGALQLHATCTKRTRNRTDK